MLHKDSGFLVTCQTCLSSSNILWPQKLFVKIHMPPCQILLEGKEAIVQR